MKSLATLGVLLALLLALSVNGQEPYRGMSSSVTTANPLKQSIAALTADVQELRGRIIVDEIQREALEKRVEKLERETETVPMNCHRPASLSSSEAICSFVPNSHLVCDRGTRYDKGKRECVAGGVKP